MSQVQSNDGLFYVNPVWYGTLQDGRKWMIKDLTLTLQVPRKSHSAAGEARELLKDWPIKVGKGEYTDYGLFPPTWEREKGFQFPLTMMGMLPTPDVYDVKTREPALDDLMYCFEVEFRTVNVWQYFQKEPLYLNSYLASFLMGQSVAVPKLVLGKIKARLRKQFAELTKLSEAEAITRFGEKVKVVRCQSVSKRSGKSTVS